MGRRAAAIEPEDLPAAARGRNRAKLQAFLERRYSPRLHMALILTASGFVSMLANWAMLAAGVGSMLVRYPIAITLSYGIFLLGVWIWLMLMGFREGPGSSDLSFDGGGGGSGGGGSGGSSAQVDLARGGGGSFDGGGASSAWGDSPVQGQAFSLKGGGGGSSGGKGFFSFDGFDLDGDGLVLVLLALALVLAIFFCSGYLVFYAPDVLTEAAFGATLSGSLVKATAKQAREGWVSGVVRKTWWPYAIVLVLAVVLAGFAHHKYPQARTFKQALSMASH